MRLDASLALASVSAKIIQDFPRNPSGPEIHTVNLSSNFLRRVAFVSMAICSPGALAAAQVNAIEVGDPQLKLEYEITELGSLGGMWHNVYVFDLNDQGDSVGYALDDQLRWRAVRWNAAGVATDIGGPPGTWSIARGISDNGVIGGLHGPSVQASRPALWMNGGIVMLPDPPRGQGVEVWDVNGAREAVGRGYSIDSFAASWSRAGAQMIADPNSYAFAINENGRAAGFVTVAGFEAAAMWDRGVLTVLPDLGPNSAKAVGVNAHGTVVGHAQHSDGFTHAVKWENGTAIDIGAYLGLFITYATGINDHGAICGGYFLDPIAEITRAVVWTQQGEMHQIGDLVAGPTDWTLWNAVEINNWGWIAGTGTRSGMQGQRSFLAKPR